MNAFPFGLKESPYTKAMFNVYLPPKEQALELTEIYYRNYAWMYVRLSGTRIPIDESAH